MDTKTLVVGQEVIMTCDIYSDTGTVVEITSSSVKVKVEFCSGFRYDTVFEFNKDGKETEDSRHNRLSHRFDRAEDAPWELCPETVQRKTADPLVTEDRRAGGGKFMMDMLSQTIFPKGVHMDIKTLKAGEKLYVHIGKREVFEATVWDEAAVKEMIGPEFPQTRNYYMHIGLSNWDGSRNYLTKGSFVAFDEDGKEIGSYGLSADGWDTRPCVTKIVSVISEGELTLRR